MYEFFRNYFLESVKRVGASLHSLGVKEVVELFPQGNAGESRNNALKTTKKVGGVF